MSRQSGEIRDAIEYPDILSPRWGMNWMTLFLVLIGIQNVAGHVYTYTWTGFTSYPNKYLNASLFIVQFKSRDLGVYTEKYLNPVLNGPRQRK